MITVIVVEPHALLRFGILKHLAEALPESRVLGVDYSSLSGAAHASAESDLVLLSIALHEDMAALIQAAQQAYAPKRILLLSDAATMPASWQNLPAVVAGYVPSGASPDVLAASIRLVLVGGNCFQSLPRAAAPVVRTPELRLVGSSWGAPKSNQPSSIVETEARMLHITPRQYEVLVLLARGYPIKTVSRHLNISVSTAKAHTETLYQQLDAHNRNQAVYTAVSRGATLGWQCPGFSDAMDETSPSPARVAC